MREKNILVVGAVYVDTIYADLPQVPEIGKEVYGNEFIITIGAMGITAIGIVKLGVNVELLSTVGDDLQGHFIKNKLREEGIKTDNLISLKGKSTSNSTAMVYNGDRGFISYKGAELTVSELIKNRIHTNNFDLSSYHCIHMPMGADSDLPKTLKLIKDNNITTSVVTGWNGAVEYAKKKKDFEGILKNSDYFFCNELEARTLTGFEDSIKAINHLAELTCPIVTFGPEGAMTIDQENKIIKAEAIEIDFVDPTGAGDSLIAGFLSGMSKNYSRKKSLQLGTICGSLSTRAVGGPTVFPDFTEAKKYLTEE